MGIYKVVKVECFRCYKKDKLEASSRQVGIIAWRERGWKYDKLRGWLCPACQKKDK
jgi:hypothetical protein